MARPKRDPLHVMVYPSNYKDKDGQRILYASANAHEEVTLEDLDEYIHKYEALPKGYVTRCFDALMSAIPYFIGEHKRVKTPLGSFYIKPQFQKRVTENEKVKSDDIWLGGIDFRPSKELRKAVESQFKSIVIDHRRHQADEEYYSKRNPQLEACLSADSTGSRYVTVKEYQCETGLTEYMARKCLDSMTAGDNPILQKTRIGRNVVYTEI